MKIKEKILAWESLTNWRLTQKRFGRKVVVTNGCFDILHSGHVQYLEAARSLGDVLLVGVNGNASVRELKGASRPINDENDRAMVVAALESVSAVCIFKEVRATEFLELAKPDIYVKGGDYTVETLNAEEKMVVAKYGRIILVKLIGGRSTTELLKKISSVA